MYAHVLLDIPTRSLDEAFSYAVPPKLEVHIGSVVLVDFAHRKCAGYVIDLSDTPLDDIDLAKVKPIERVLALQSFSVEAVKIARWLSDTYVAPISECLRLFLPPGTSPRLKLDETGELVVAPARVSQKTQRWVSLTRAGREYVPAANAKRQKILIDALSCGPVTTSDLNALYTNMSAVISTLEKKGVVTVEERRWIRGCEGTTLSSATASAPVDLTQGQRCALEAIDKAYERSCGDVVVVDGVTGSGKTEVYLSAIEKVLAQGKSACVLVPEISLTAQTVGRFRSRFGNEVAVFHSRLSPGERYDQWDLVRSGQAHVVVGARSALFCPFEHLGLIVIDEEHETSYKQGSSPRYHARELAAKMAQVYGCPLVLGSATPSLEALQRCNAGEFDGVRWTRVEMRERPGIAKLPEVKVVDLRREFAQGSRSMFSKEFLSALNTVIERRQKAVILHNRRGFAPFLMCRECGCVPTCKHCSTALTYHERTNTLECHTCGATYHVRPYPQQGSKCPKCGSRYLAKMGVGTQQVEDALRAILPEDVALIRMDADSTRTKDAHKKLLEEFDAADCAVLLGTQMVAKGLDFPEVTMVGIVNADYSLKMPDFRANECSFALLEQVAGRAGRGEDPGQVIIQTYLPDHPVIKAVQSHDRMQYLSQDLACREELGYPPFMRLSNVLVWGPYEKRTREYATKLAMAVMDLLEPDSGVAVLGPTDCVITRAKDKYRFHFVVKSPYSYDVSRVIKHALAQIRPREGMSISVDIDAYDLM